MDSTTLSLIIGFIGATFGISSLIYAYHCQKQNKAIQEAMAAEIRNHFKEVKTSLSVVGVDLVEFKSQSNLLKYPEIQQQRNFVKQIQAFFIGIGITILIALIFSYLTKPRKRRN